MAAVLARREVLAKLRLTPIEARALVMLLRRRSVIVEPSVVIRQSRDPADDKFLECAVAGGAHCLVSADADLLVLGQVREIPIIDIRAFWARLDDRARRRLIAAEACAGACTPMAAVRVRGQKYRACFRGRAVRFTLHGEGPAGDQWTNRACATARSRADVPPLRAHWAAPRPVRRPDAPPLGGGDGHGMCVLHLVEPPAELPQRARHGAFDTREERARRRPERHRPLERGPAQLVVRPRHAGLLLREGERVGPLAERAQLVERRAGTDQ